MTPCDPSRFCPQRDGCARWHSTADEPALDGMALLSASQRWCPLFVDRRGLALKPVAVRPLPASIGRLVAA